MKELVTAEFLKLRTTRLVYGLLFATLALAVAGTLGTIAVAGNMEQTFSLETAQGVRNVFSNAGAGSIFVLVLGILGMTSEFRHNTVTETFLVTPTRGQVVTAKLVTFAVVGLILAVLAAAVTVAVALPALASKGVDVSVGDYAGVLAGVTAVTVVYGLLGVAVGSLIRNSTAAVIVALAWTFVIEGLLVSLLPEVGRWLPGGAAQALSGQSIPGSELLAPAIAALLLVAYAVVFATAGTRFVVGRDIT
jgi:ABC-type transport system involved in multi-copper enzyme maturation permease subunit